MPTSLRDPIFILFLAAVLGIGAWLGFESWRQHSCTDVRLPQDYKNVKKGTIIGESCTEILMPQVSYNVRFYKEYSWLAAAYNDMEPEKSK